MSYTRRYHEVIHGSVSKTVTINGQSETVSVPYSEPVDITIHVDTNLFDSKVDGCCTSVNVLTGAVVAAESAEVATKHATSRQIGNSLLQGFFSYIRTDLSQQIKQLLSKTEAKLVEMAEQGKDCLHRKDVMGNDYARITKRYSALFTDLDKELANRIRNLTQPIFTFVEQTAESLSRPMDTGLLGVASVSADETFRLDAVLKGSSIKCRAQKLLEESNRYLEGTYKLQNSVRDMLRTGYEPGVRYLPVAYVESNVSAQGIDRKIYGTDNIFLRGCTRLAKDLETNFQDKTLKWSDMDAQTRENIQTYFNDELSRSGVSRRVADTIRSLQANNPVKTIK